MPSHREKAVYRAHRAGRDWTEAPLKADAGLYKASFPWAVKVGATDWRSIGRGYVLCPGLGLSVIP